MDLEDPASLATFLVTANIKLIRAEWLGDALDVISGHTAAGRLNLRKLTMSAISEGSNMVQYKSELWEAAGPHFQAIKYQAVMLFLNLVCSQDDHSNHGSQPELGIHMKSIHQFILQVQI